jgi:hypothetical protein
MPPQAFFLPPAGFFCHPPYLNIVIYHQRFTKTSLKNKAWLIKSESMYRVSLMIVHFKIEH